MSLSGRSYFLTALITALAVTGQWSSGEIGYLWHYPAALLLCALLLEGLRARHDTLYIRHHCGERLSLGEQEQLVIEVRNPTPAGSGSKPRPVCPHHCRVAWHWSTG